MASGTYGRDRPDRDALGDCRPRRSPVASSSIKTLPHGGWKRRSEGSRSTHTRWKTRLGRPVGVVQRVRSPTAAPEHCCRFEARRGPTTSLGRGALETTASEPQRQSSWRALFAVWNAGEAFCAGPVQDRSNPRVWSCSFSSLVPSIDKSSSMAVHFHRPTHSRPGRDIPSAGGTRIASW